MCKNISLRIIECLKMRHLSCFYFTSIHSFIYWKEVNTHPYQYLCNLNCVSISSLRLSINFKDNEIKVPLTNIEIFLFVIIELEVIKKKNYNSFVVVHSHICEHLHNRFNMSNCCQIIKKMIG